MTSMHGQKPSEERISKKKIIYPVNDELRLYLAAHSRVIDLPVKYDDLLRFNNALAVYDKKRQDTL